MHGRHFAGGWIVAGQRWDENPLIALPGWVWGVIDLWQLCRAYAGPFGGMMLPGGSLSAQPAALLDAFAILDRKVDP